MNHVCAVVVTYNRLPMLKQCIDSVISQTCKCDIILIDNASTDGTGAWAAEQAANNPVLHYHNTGANLGGAGGFNAGMKLAVEAGYPYVWVMDDDCFPQADALEHLLEASALLEDSYGFLASAVLWTDGSECKMNHPKARKQYYEYLPLLKHGLLSIEQATFVSCFFKADMIRKVGLPIREFFIWGDDIEYTRRIAVRNQTPCFLVGRSIVIHHMAKNIGSSIVQDSRTNLKRYRYAYRNENYLYRKEGIKGFFYYFAKCCLHSIRIIRTAPDAKLKRLGIIFKQFFAGLFFNPKIENLK